MTRAALVPCIQDKTAPADLLSLSGPLNNMTATIFVVQGASSGLKHELTKSRTTIGSVGGGADIEVSDPHMSEVHCVVTVARDEDVVRLYDLDSASGTYIHTQRLQATNLDHCSEFRIGSTVFLVTIVPRHSTENTSGDMG